MACGSGGDAVLGAEPLACRATLAVPGTDIRRGLDQAVSGWQALCIITGWMPGLLLAVRRCGGDVRGGGLSLWGCTSPLQSVFGQPWLRRDDIINRSEGPCEDSQRWAPPPSDGTANAHQWRGGDRLWGGECCPIKLKILLLPEIRRRASEPPRFPRRLLLRHLYVPWEFPSLEICIFFTHFQTSILLHGICSSQVSRYLNWHLITEQAAHMYVSRPTSGRFTYWN